MIVDYAIETTGLCKKFGNTVAVDHINLKVERGRFFGFLGPNGAGKSTTINMLIGLLDITEGEARILGKDIQKEGTSVKSQVGIVPEKLALFDRLTGFEYLKFVGRMHGLEREAIKQRQTDLLNMMDLEEHACKLIVDYSSGMRKKIALAGALIHNPKLLFLDEPFEGIDAVASNMIKNLLQRLTRLGVTIFLTSHILEIVEKLCEEIAIIHQGKLVAQGRLADMRKGPEVDGEHGQERSLEQIFLDIVDSDARERTPLSWLGEHA